MGSVIWGFGGGIFFRPVYSAGLPQLQNQTHQGPVIGLFMHRDGAVRVSDIVRYGPAGQLCAVYERVSADMCGIPDSIEAEVQVAIY